MVISHTPLKYGVASSQILISQYNTVCNSKDSGTTFLLFKVKVGYLKLRVYNMYCTSPNKIWSLLVPQIRDSYLLGASMPVIQI